jgi:hypothetical protein
MLATALVNGTPWLIVAAWLIAGQWDLSGSESRAWLRFVVPIAVACLVPLTGHRPPAETIARRLRWVGWAIVAGLLVTS